MENVKVTFPFLNDINHQHSKFYHRLEVPADTILIKEGQNAKKAFLIEKGCVRAWINNKGKEITFDFFFENEAVTSSESFRKNIPSFFTIQTIEPCVLHWIWKSDWEKVIEEISRIPQIRSQAINSSFERQYKYMRQLISYINETPEQRYVSLLKEKPQILNRIPLHHIATFLGVTSVSLSRIRKRVSRK